MTYVIIGLSLALMFVWLMSRKRSKKLEEHSNTFVNFINENPDRSALIWKKEGETIVTHQEAKSVNLSGIHYLIIAITYAKRAASKHIDPDEIISFDQIDDFYIPKSDGGAHMAWFKSISKSISEGGIPLKEVVKGMLHYNSNANAEFLMEKLGLMHINKQLEELGLDEHSPIYFDTSARFVRTEIKPELPLNEWMDYMKNVDQATYLVAASSVHGQLLSNPEIKYNFPEFDVELQRVWSDHLPKSTVGLYSDLLGRINSRAYFEQEVQSLLEEVVLSFSEYPASAKWLDRFGSITGYTAFSLSRGIFATDKEGRSTELVYAFSDLSFQELTALRRAMPTFEMKVLTDNNYLEWVKMNLDAR